MPTGFLTPHDVALDKGQGAELAWEEFFQAEIANVHTRKNYMHAVRRFLGWVGRRESELARIAPGDVGEYLAGHAGPRTKRIYDRRRCKVTRNIVERTSIKGLDPQD